MSKLSKKIRKLFGKKKEDSESNSSMPIDTESFIKPTRNITYFSTDKDRFVEAEVPERVTIATPSLYSPPSLYSFDKSSTRSSGSLSSVDSDDDFFNYMFKSSKSSNSSEPRLRRRDVGSLSSFDTLAEPFVVKRQSSISSLPSSRSSSLSSIDSNIFKGNKVFTLNSSDSSDFYI